jgi:hypothetical protein
MEVHQVARKEPSARGCLDCGAEGALHAGRLDAASSCAALGFVGRASRTFQRAGVSPAQWGE